jgi:microcystin-dependent protein
MAEPFVGEIRMFAGNFAPRDWAYCDGQLISTASNPTLFSLIQTYYGGDGVSTFALPDLRGRLPVGDGTGVGLTPRRLGEQIGTEVVYLGAQNMPPHSHAFQASQDGATATLPTGKVLANTAPNELYEDIDPQDNIVPLNEQCIQPSGGEQPHGNLMPSLCIHFIIALKGVYPTRS